MKFHQYFPSVLLGSTAGWLLTFAIGFENSEKFKFTSFCLDFICMVLLVTLVLVFYAF